MSIRERLFTNQVKHITIDTGDPRTAAVRAQVLRDIGVLVAPFALHLPSPQALAGYWAIFREPTCGKRVERAKKEAVAAAVSALNTCPYCVDVHTTVLRAVGDTSAATAIAAGRSEDITDSDLRGLVAWAQATRSPGSPLLATPPFPEHHAPELVGIAVAYHYVNRMVNIFAADTPFGPGSLPLKRILRALAVPLFRRAAARPMAPGTSLELLGRAADPAPAEFAWAQSDPVIAEAFTRAAHAFDTAGAQVLPEQTRELVIARLDAWDGQDPGISRAWTEPNTANLPTVQQPLARLALLAAFASYQVDARILHEARPLPGPQGDQALVATAAWASFTAARRIGAWLNPSPNGSLELRTGNRQG